MHMPKYSEIEHFDELKEAGMSEKQAKAVLHLVNASAEINFNDLVTKDYLNARLSQFELKLSRRFNALLITVVFSILAPLIFHHFGLI